MTDLTQLDGIGPKRARALNALGLQTFADVAAVDAAGLAGYLSIDDATAANVVAQAADLAGTAAESVGAPTSDAPEQGIYLLTGRYRG